jgi:Fe2+ transport system protein FeoA
MMMPLDMLRTGEWAEICQVSGEPAWVGHLAAMGLREGGRLQVLQAGATCLLQVENCRLCLRDDNCSQILVRPVSL